MVLAIINEHVKFLTTITLFNTGVYNNNKTMLDSVRKEAPGDIDFDIQ